MSLRKLLLKLFFIVPLSFPAAAQASFWFDCAYVIEVEAASEPYSLSGKIIEADTVDGHVDDSCEKNLNQPFEVHLAENPEEKSTEFGREVTELIDPNGLLPALKQGDLLSLKYKFYNDRVQDGVLNSIEIHLLERNGADTAFRDGMRQIKELF